MAALMNWLNSLTPKERDDMPATDVEQLRRETLALLDDCSGTACVRLRMRLSSARTPQELWMARCDIFQLVASQHCQAQAAQRINALLPHFEGWLPARLLTPV